ncbi:proline-rich proteoglycan 2-like [Cervus elaphus]|uniref:proline-rich proteoglycan 2-like n=1 Tax=Cervus elaphus TaxID=9860 RepID=UPI001CC28B30|nr:proline-rich proteoglycan 2-like [Cervus elaphus]
MAMLAAMHSDQKCAVVACHTDKPDSTDPKQRFPGLRARGAKDRRPGRLKISEEGPTSEPGNLAPSSQPEGDAPPPTPAAERRGGSGARSCGKPARRKRRTQEKGVRKWPVCSRTETQQPGCPAQGARLPRHRQRSACAREARRPRGPQLRPPPSPGSLRRRRRQNPSGNSEPRGPARRAPWSGGEGLRSPPPRRPARLPSPEPTHLLLLLLLVSPSWPPARPSRRRADAGPLPRGRSRRRRRPARPAAAAASGRVRRMPRPLGPPTRSRPRLQRCRDAAGP